MTFKVHDSSPKNVLKKEQVSTQQVPDPEEVA